MEGILMYENSFIQKCLNGEADLSELDDYIEYYKKIKENYYEKK